MKLEFENINSNLLVTMRRLGYIFQRYDKDEASFIRPLVKAGYPRFHVYACLKNNRLIMNIHLDHKKNTYGKSARHHAEYEDEGPLRTEIERIKKVISEC